MLNKNSIFNNGNTGKIERLKQLLNGPLPGNRAQFTMAPEGRINYTDGKCLREAGVIIILYPEKEKLNIVYMKRPDYEGIHGGQICFPGGKKEKTDPSVKAAAIRECKEELGIEIDKQKILGVLSPLHIPVSNFTVYPYLTFLDKRPHFKPDNFEVAAIIEASLADLAKAAIIGRENWIINNLNLNVPYYKTGNEKIWGATAMITAELLEILKIAGMVEE